MERTTVIPLQHSSADSFPTKTAQSFVDEDTFTPGQPDSAIAAGTMINTTEPTDSGLSLAVLSLSDNHRPRPRPRRNISTSNIHEYNNDHYINTARFPFPHTFTAMQQRPSSGPTTH